MFTINDFDPSDERLRYRLTADLSIQQSYIAYFGQYERALNILINYLLETKTRVDMISHPVLYLMRHSLELAYKGNVEYFQKYTGVSLKKPKSGGHNLFDLHEQFGNQIQILINQLPVSTWDQDSFFALYQETAELLKQLRGDEASIFRYHDVNKRKFFNRNDELDVTELLERFKNAGMMLTHTSDIFSRYTDYVELIQRQPDFNKGKGEVWMTFKLFEKEFVYARLDKEFKRTDDDEWFDSETKQRLQTILINETFYLFPLK